MHQPRIRLLLSIQKSTRQDKKLVARFSDGTVTHFGASGYSDYTQHRDLARKQRYLQRHRPKENWQDPTSAGALSRWVLWNKPTISASIADFKTRFRL
jgi:hypothetical protein